MALFWSVIGLRSSASVSSSSCFRLLAKKSDVRRAARPLSLAAQPANSVKLNCGAYDGDDAIEELTIDEEQAALIVFWSRFAHSLSFSSCAFWRTGRVGMNYRCTAARC